MGAIAHLLNMALGALSMTVIVGIILAMIRQSFHPRWADAPLVRMLILAALAICRPMRELMEKVGIPTRPLDFSPMATVFVIQIIQRVLAGIG